MYYYRSLLRKRIIQKYGHMLEHEEITRRSGVPRSTVTKWLNDNRRFRHVRLHVVESLAKWLECRPEDLYELVEANGDENAA